VKGRFSGGFHQHGVVEHPLFYTDALPEACGDSVEWFHISTTVNFGVGSDGPGAETM
jgi:hypothetical protein